MGKLNGHPYYNTTHLLNKSKQSLYILTDKKTPVLNGFKNPSKQHRADVRADP